MDRPRLSHILLCGLISSFLVPLSAAQDRTAPTKAGPQSTRNKFKRVPIRTAPIRVWRKWLEDVRWIISDEEIAEFNKLTTDLQRDNFIGTFWESRNPNPGSAENRFREEHYRRIRFTNEYYSYYAAQGLVPGRKSDRGHIYIRFGPPDWVTYDPSMEYPESEAWHYAQIKDIGDNVVFTFMSAMRCCDYRLTDGQVDPPFLGFLKPF